jgi:molybdate transport system regulatory protein
MMPVRKPAIRNHITLNARDHLESGQHVCPDISLRVRAKVWLELDGQFVIGEGGLDLLDSIVRSGSLTRAARHVGWSYRHAWGYLKNAERVLRVRLTTAKPGKGHRRGTILTEAGRALFQELSSLRQKIDEHSSRFQVECAAL